MITPPTSEPTLIYSVGDLISDSLIEAGIKSPGEETEADVGQWALRKANYRLDTWATSKKYVYCSTWGFYTLNPNLPVQPDGSALATIGPAPGATYPAAQRPVKILSAAVILNNTTPPVLALIDINDNQWWAGVTLPGIQSMYPTNLYYNPTHPNGTLYFWPRAQQAFGLRLELWCLLSQFGAITDPIGGPGASATLPPGYRNALMLTLAEDLGPASEKGNPQLTAMAAAARAAIFGNNSPSPNISTLDSGMPGGQEGRRSTTFSYRTRTWT